MNRPLYQSDESYKRTLQELRRRVENNFPLEYYDSTIPGDKNTECTLGLCDDEIQASQDGVYQGKGHVCPNDRRYFQADGTRLSSGDTLGCFFECRVFQERSSLPEVQARIMKATEA